MIKGLIGCMLGLVCLGVSCFAADGDFPYDSPPPTPSTKFGTIKADTINASIKDSAIDPDGPIQKLIKLFLPNRPAGENVLGYIQYIINIALSLVAFIAIIVLIYGFYGILFRDSQEGITNAKKTVKGTLIAIVVMGASWLIVQALFYVVTKL